MSRGTNAKERIEREQGIAAVGVRGYKSLAEEISIEVRPLTILAGANSSGKSSMMQPLLLLKQTLEASYDPGPLLLNGPNVHFTSADQFLSRVIENSSNNSLIVSLELVGKQSFTNLFQKQPGQSIELIETEYHQPDSKIVARYDMTRSEILSMIPNESKSLYDREMLSWQVNRIKCFLSIQVRVPFTTEILTSESPEPQRFIRHIRRIIHVSGLRGNPERTYKTTAIGAEFPGTFENYIASIVNHWQTTADLRLKELESALQRVGLAQHLSARQIDDTQVELHVSLNRQDTTKYMTSIADVGLGVSQVMPVLVALLVAEPGQLVYLEQPEIHLHPRAQAALAHLLAEAAKRGVRVVAETHSALLLLAVQSLVAEGNLSPDLVKLHWFRRRDDGVSEIFSTDLDKAGAFGEWPEDFADVELEWQSRYLDAAEARLSGG